MGMFWGTKQVKDQYNPYAPTSQDKNGIFMKETLSEIVKELCKASQ